LRDFWRRSIFDFFDSIGQWLPKQLRAVSVCFFAMRALEQTWGGHGQPTVEHLRHTGQGQHCGNHSRRNTPPPDPPSETAAKDAAVPWLDPDNVSTF
jgi:hypothetical protein